MPLADPPAHPRPDPFMHEEKRQAAGRRGEGEAHGGYHVAGVEPGQGAGHSEAEGLPGDGFGDGSEFRFHGLRRLPVLVASGAF